MTKSIFVHRLMLKGPELTRLKTIVDLRRKPVIGAHGF
jgi:hypothetical protein